MTDNETKKKLISLFKQQLSMLQKFKDSFRGLQYVLDDIQNRDGNLKVVEKKDLLEFKLDVKGYENFLNSYRSYKQQFLNLEKEGVIPHEYMQKWLKYLSDAELRLAFCAQSCIVKQSLDFEYGGEAEEAKVFADRGMAVPKRRYHSDQYSCFFLRDGQATVSGGESNNAGESENS